MTSASIVQKLWNSCNVLRDDGMSYGDYPSVWLRTGSEQLTYLLFLKMADEWTNCGKTVRQAGNMIIYDRCETPFGKIDTKKSFLDDRSRRVPR
jgi:hypothetical protein